MIYIDTSVALAHLLAEDRSPPDSLWDAGLVASRLLACELWGRIHARDLASILFLTERGHAVTLATYDARMGTAAEALGVGLLDLG